MAAAAALTLSEGAHAYVDGHRGHGNHHTVTPQRHAKSGIEPPRISAALIRDPSLRKTRTARIGKPFANQHDFKCMPAIKTNYSRTTTSRLLAGPDECDDCWPQFSHARQREAPCPEWLHLDTTPVAPQNQELAVRGPQHGPQQLHQP